MYRAHHENDCNYCYTPFLFLAYKHSWHIFALQVVPKFDDFVEILVPRMELLVGEDMPWYLTQHCLQHVMQAM